MREPKEKVKSKLGKIVAIVIAPIIPDNGLLSGEYPIKAWISDDARKVPVKIEVKIILGAVEINLKEYSSKKTLATVAIPGAQKK